LLDGVAIWPNRNDLLYGGQGDDTLLISVNAPGDSVTVDGSVGTHTLDLSGFGVAAWVDLVTNGAEVRTTDQADLTAGTWRNVANVARVENVTGTAYSDELDLVGAGLRRATHPRQEGKVF
jgi:hypothetical protein